MSGISSKALQFGSAGNMLKYNGKEEQRKEFSDGNGLDWLDYGARMYNNQIGRFQTLDPLGDITRKLSVYSYASNNPLKYFDFNGLFPVNPNIEPKYYHTRELAAYGWAKLYGHLGADGKHQEYSGVIYKTKRNGVDVFGFTDAIPYYATDQRWAKSPGPRDPLHKVPSGASIVAHIHIHWEGSGKANETFSDNQGRGDSKLFGDENINLYFYLINSVGKLIGRFPEELEPDDPNYDSANPNENSRIQGETFDLAEGFYSGHIKVLGYKLSDEIRKGRDKPINMVSPMYSDLYWSAPPGNVSNQSNDNESGDRQQARCPVFY